MKSARVSSFIKQVEVAPAVALLDIRETVERVRQRRADAGEQHELVDDQRRLAAAALRRVADRADDVAQVHVDLAGARLGAEQLDPARAVDQVEEDELAHVAAREDAARESPGLGALFVRLQRLGFGADGYDLVAVGKTLGGRHGDLTIAQA